MLPEHEFCDNCSGCRPAILNVETGKVFEKDSPVMQSVDKYWDNETTYEQRHAFIEVTLHNSRNPVLMERCQVVMEKVGELLKEALE